MKTFACRHVVYRCQSITLAVGIVLLSVPPNVRAAVDPDIPRLQAEAERGSIQREVELGSAYFSGHGVAQDEKRAAYWFEKAANAGDPWAQMEIGYFYQAGTGVARDPAKAAKWFQRAAAGGLVTAKVNLGVAYLVGSGVRKDAALAENLFRQAFAQGDGVAAFYLGVMYSQGTGVQRDEAAGERWFEAGAKLHDPRSELRLATLIWRRQNDLNDARKAIKLLRESAAAGLVNAKHQLGITLVKNPQLASSPDEASTLLKEAAEAGEWRSSVALGLLSRDGIAGVPVDPRAAYYHYRVAVLQGGEEARRIVSNDLEGLSSRIGSQQAAAMDADASAWFANHHVALTFIAKDGMKWKDFPAYAVATPEEGTYAGRLFPIDPAQQQMTDPGHRAGASMR